MTTTRHPAEILAFLLDVVMARNEDGEREYDEFDEETHDAVTVLRALAEAGVSLEEAGDDRAWSAYWSDPFKERDCEKHVDALTAQLDRGNACAALLDVLFAG